MQEEKTLQIVDFWVLVYPLRLDFKLVFSRTQFRPRNHPMKLLTTMHQERIRLLINSSVKAETSFAKELYFSLSTSPRENQSKL